MIKQQYESKDVRLVIKNGEPWWVAVDVCDILEHSNSRMAVSGLDEDEKGVSKVYTPSGDQDMTIITEAIRPLESDEKSTLSLAEGGYNV